MMPNTVNKSAAVWRGAHAQLFPLIWQLVDALRSESRLVGELVDLMRQQRAAVAADELQAVEDATFGIQRVLHTLSEARRRRRSINLNLGVVESVSLRDLLASLGPMATPELREERDRLQEVARVLANEVAINREVLREALATGDSHVRAVTGAAPAPGYGAAAKRNAALIASYLIDRQA